MNWWRRRAEFPESAWHRAAERCRISPGIWISVRSSEPKGIVAFDPPKVGTAFPVLVPQVNADGNETAGIRLPEQMVPLATYTGWNLRDPKIGAPDVIYNMVGSFIPFARTKAEREAAGDPRLSIEERYADKDEYLKKVKEAAEALVGARFLLKEDVDKVGAKAASRWDLVVSDHSLQN